MPFTIRRPVQIELPRRPRENEERRKRSRLADEMEKFREAADKADTRENRRILAEQRKGEQVRQLQQELAPTEGTPDFRVREAAARGRQLAEAEREAPGQLTRIRDVLAETGVSPAEFRAGARGEERGEDVREAARRLTQPEDPEGQQLQLQTVVDYAEQLRADGQLSEDDVEKVRGGDVSAVIEKIVSVAAARSREQGFVDPGAQAAIGLHTQQTQARQELAPAGDPFTFVGAGLGEAGVAGLEQVGVDDPRIQAGVRIGAPLITALAAGTVPTGVLPRVARPLAAAFEAGPIGRPRPPARQAPRVGLAEDVRFAVDEPFAEAAQVAAERPMQIAGAGEAFASPLRSFEDVVGEVVTRDDPVAQVLARLGVSPSLLETSDVGRATVAYARQRGASEQLINVALQSAIDSHATGLGGRLPIDIGDDAFATLNSGRRVPWNDLFSTNKFDNELDAAQRAFVGDYRRVVDEVEFLRVQAGLKPRATSGKEAAEGWYYIPRQVKGIRGNELRRPSNPGIQRHYDEAVQGIENGIKYESDPRAVLDLHLRQAYREIAEKQLSDFLEPLSVTPKELIPEPVLQRMSNAVTQRLSAERNLRGLRAQRLRAQTGGRFVGEEAKAQRTLRAAKLPEREAITGSIETAQTELNAAMKQYNTAKNAYSKALEQARRAELAPGNLFGRAEDVIPVAQWRNRFFPLEDAEKLTEVLGSFLQSPKRANWVGRGFEVLGNHIRFLSAVGDFAAPFIQGLPLLGRNPVAWSRATWAHYVAFADPTIQARFIRDNIDTMQEMAAHNVPVGDVEFFKALQQGQGFSAGRLLEGLPKGSEARNLLRGVGRQTFGRFQASYDMFLTSARAQLWDSMKVGWKGSLDDLAAHVRNMTGGLDSRALGVGPTQRGFESTWLAFSPRLLRSTVALVTDMRNPTSPQGQAAIRALGGLVAGTVGIYIVSGIAMGKSEKEIRTGLNPLEGKKFLAYNITGDWIGVGGQVRAIMQLLARSLADPSSLASADQFDNPLLTFAASRGAPGFRVAQTLVEGITGREALPFEDIDSLPEMFLHIGQSSLPFALQGLLEGEGATAFVTGLAGARTSPTTEFESFEFARQEVMRERGLTGNFADLDQVTRAEIDRDPRVEEARQPLGEREPRTIEDVGFQAAASVTEASIQAQEQDDQQLDEFFTQGGTFDPQRHSNALRQRLRDRFGAREAIFTAAGIEFEEGERPTNPIDRAIFDYFSVDIDRFTDAEGEINWAAFNEAQDAALSPLSATDRERVIDEVIKKNETPLQRQFRKLRDELDEYYDIPSENRTARTNWRRRHPRQDAILFLTGSTATLTSGQSSQEALGLARRLFGESATLPTGLTRGTGGGTLIPGPRDLIPSARDLVPSARDLVPSGRDLVP